MHDFLSCFGRSQTAKRSFPESTVHFTADFLHCVDHLIRRYSALNARHCHIRAGDRIYTAQHISFYAGNLHKSRNRIADKSQQSFQCQRRRMALARVLLSDRPLWLLDEPDNALDVDGSALLAQVERTFTASETLKCLMENKNALRFYQRHGWTIEAQGASPEGGYWLMRSPRP